MKRPEASLPVSLHGVLEGFRQRAALSLVGWLAAWQAGAPSRRLCARFFICWPRFSVCQAVPYLPSAELYVCTALRNAASLVDSLRSASSIVPLTHIVLLHLHGTYPVARVAALYMGTAGALSVCYVYVRTCSREG